MDKGVKNTYIYMLYNKTDMLTSISDVEFISEEQYRTKKFRHNLNCLVITTTLKANFGGFVF